VQPTDMNLDTGIKPDSVVSALGIIRDLTHVTLWSNGLGPTDRDRSALQVVEKMLAFL